MTDYISRESVLQILSGKNAAWDAYQKVQSLPAADVVPMDFHERCLQIEIQKRMALEKADVRPVEWIPVTERLPETGVDVLVMFPHNMAVASRDMGEWVVNSGDGWCTDVNLSDDEKEPTHWMPLPAPPKEKRA